jgi:hypothetical protein
LHVVKNFQVMVFLQVVKHNTRLNPVSNFKENTPFSFESIFFNFGLALLL